MFFNFFQKQQLQLLFQNTIVKIRALQNPTPEVTTILQNIYSTPASTFSGTYGQTTSNTNNSFSQQQSSNIFATQFGQTTNAPFGSTPTMNIIGGGLGTQAPTNIFASAPAPTAPPNQNIFASATSNIFANSASNPSNLFAAQASNLPPFSGAQQQSTNIFAKPQNMFTPQPMQAPQTMFVSQAQPQQPNNMFGVTTTPSTQQSVPPPNYSASIFGNTANMNPSLSFGQSVDESLYSKLEDLSAEEKKWFESDTMDILNIPDKPPTYDMCFKM